MAADDKETDQEPRASRTSDSGPEVANPADDRSTFIGLGTDQDDRSTFIGLGSNREGVSGPPSEAHEVAASSVSREGAGSEEERAKAPPPTPSLESNAVGLEDATSRLKPASKNEPAAVVEAEPASDSAEAPDSAEARKAEPNTPEIEKPASTDGAATGAGTSPASGVAPHASAKGQEDANGAQKPAASSQAPRKPEVAQRGSRAVGDAVSAPATVTPRKTSRGALLFVLAGIALVGGFWLANRETNPSEKLDTPTTQQEPAPANTEATGLSAATTTAEPAAQAQAQPLAQAQPSDDRAAKASTKLAAEVPSNAPVANAPEDKSAAKPASSQLKPRRAALVAIAKDREMRHCRRKPDPVGTAQALVTFEPSGSVSGVRLFSPYVATHTGVCLTERLKQIAIDPFSGESVTVQAAIELY